MTTAFVLGNGVSRQSVKLTELQKHGKIYGCNALYREFTPDVLVATDKPIATKIQQSGYSNKNRFYTRRPINGLGALMVPVQYHGYSSGPIAASLACLDNNKIVYLIGFDMGPTEENKFNNIYADTEFYKTSTATPTFAGNWAKQLCRIIADYPQAQFIRVVGPTTAVVSEFDSLQNLSNKDLTTFITSINNKKDL
jgi:hypothetical protein